MLSKTRGIVLRNIDYSDSSIITRIFTEQAGVQGYLVKGAKNRKAAIRPSQLMPLTLCELVVYHKPGSGLQAIRELKCNPVLHRMHYEIPRSAVAMFSADLLARTLSEEHHADEALFAFLHHLVQAIDNEKENLPYLPLYLCISLCGYLGFAPKYNFSERYSSFDVLSGEFVLPASSSLYLLNERLSERLFRLMQAGLPDLSSLGISRMERAELLEAMIRYMEMHMAGTGKIQSHHILKEVFD